MQHYLETGRGIVPDPDRRIRPAHFDPRRRRYGPSNHLAVAFHYPHLVLKQGRTFDLWDTYIYNDWVSRAAGAHVRELRRVVDSLRTKIGAIMRGAPWARDPKRASAVLAREVNRVTGRELDAKGLEKYYRENFDAVVRHAPEMYAKRHRFMAVTRFDTFDRDGVKFLAGVGRDSAERSIGKYIDEGAGKKITDLARGAVKHGLTPDEIASRVGEYVTEDVRGNKESYARLVADQLMSRARSHSSLKSMASAGFTQYQVMAVLDEVTTDICRYMHGKIISVPEAVEVHSNAYKQPYTPEALGKTSPWIKQKEDKLMVGRTTLARVKESGRGKWGATGTFDDQGKDLTAQNISTPPYHPNCRTTIVPVFNTRSLGYARGTMEHGTTSAASRYKGPGGVAGAGAAAGAVAMDASPLKRYETIHAAAKAEQNGFDAWAARKGTAVDRPRGKDVSVYLADTSQAVKQPISITKSMPDRSAKKIRAWAEELFRGKRREPVTVDVVKTGTSSYSSTGERIKFRKESIDKRTFAHEYAHHCEYQNPDLLRATSHYYQVMTEGKKIATHKLYGWRYYRGAFVEDYMSKVTDRPGAEIISVMVEKTVTYPAKMLKAHPDLFYLALALLKGKI